MREGNLEEVLVVRARYLTRFKIGQNVQLSPSLPYKVVINGLILFEGETEKSARDFLKENGNPSNGYVLMVDPSSLHEFYGPDYGMEER